MELYKVVEKEERYGSNWAMYKESYVKTQTYEEGIQFRDAHPELFPQYLKGSKLQALQSTLGFMLFEKLWQAERFMDGNFVFKDQVEIIKVVPLDEPIIRPRENTIILHGCGLHIDILKHVNKIRQDKQSMNSQVWALYDHGITYGVSTISFITSYKLVVLD